MNTLQKTQIITQIISAVVLLVTLEFYYLQLRTMGKQLATMRRGTEAHQIPQILEPFLQEMQKPENGGPQYWNGFDWPYSQLDTWGLWGGRPRT